MYLDQFKPIHPVVIVRETDADSAPVVAADHRGVFLLGDLEPLKPGFPSNEDLDEGFPCLIDVDAAVLLRDGLVKLGAFLKWPAESPLDVDRAAFIGRLRGIVKAWWQDPTEMRRKLSDALDEMPHL